MGQLYGNDGHSSGDVNVYWVASTTLTDAAVGSGTVKQFPTGIYSPRDYIAQEANTAHKP